MIIPNIRFNSRIITTTKKLKSKANLFQYFGSLSSSYSKVSPIPPPDLSPLFNVDVKHMTSEPQ